MRKRTTAVLILISILIILIATVSCDRSEKQFVAYDAAALNQGAIKASPGFAGESQAKPATASAGEMAVRLPFQKTEPAITKISLESANASQGSAQITERKIIRNAELTIEIDDPRKGLQKIASIAEKNGGFIISSESKDKLANEQKLTSTTITITARVPAAQFGDAVEAIRQIAGKITIEKISGIDVTEDYIDLEARIRTKRALEMQFLEIMRQARKISDALEVQSQLADVRTEIESLEGRRRFLENKSALSTISVTLQSPAPLFVATKSGFQNSVKMAFGDGLDTASEIVLGVIRFVMVIIPIAILILFPCWLLFKLARRYIPWPKSAAPATGVSDRVD
jgi:Domain of unknown function (DUF4349)